MVAWILGGDKDPNHIAYVPPRALRKAGRLLLKQSVQGRLLLSKERPRDPNASDSEPEISP